MKYVVVPEAVAIVNFITKEPLKYDQNHPQRGENVAISMHKFLNDNILSSPKIGKGLEALRRVMKIDSAFENTVGGDIVGIEDADYVAVQAIVHEMEFSDTRLAVQMLPFFEALESAASQTEDWKKKQTLKAMP